VLCCIWHGYVRGCLKATHAVGHAITLMPAQCHCLTLMHMHMQDNLSKDVRSHLASEAARADAAELSAQEAHGERTAAQVGGDMHRAC
jgi:hypothetical protein